MAAEFRTEHKMHGARQGQHHSKQQMNNCCLRVSLGLVVTGHCLVRVQPASSSFIILTALSLLLIFQTVVPPQTMLVSLMAFMLLERMIKRRSFRMKK